jgi:hypothetical protein
MPKYKIVGVDKESGLDTDLVVEATDRRTN